MAGYDTAGEIQNTYSSAHSEFGTDPNFWVRYFTPSPAADILSDNAEAECIGAWDSGGPHIMCICAPIQSRLSGSTAEGQADAQSMCASMLTGYHAVAPLNLPSVISAIESPIPCPTSAPVTASISRIPGPPFGPS